MFDSAEIVADILGNLAGLNRNIISEDFNKSLGFLKKYIPLQEHRYLSGTDCWTWTVPPGWTVKDAYIRHDDGKVLVSVKDHPLHVMSYSQPVCQTLSGRELLEHVYTHQEIPDAIPYEFSFYIKKWGFCLTQKQKEEIVTEKQYEVLIDSSFEPDYLVVGQYTIKGKSDEHVFLLSHLDHPFQVNDGLVGVAVNVALAKLLEKKKDLYYNYTILITSETIGSLAFLSHHEELIPRIRCGIFNEMVGLSNPFIVQKSYKDRGLINAYAAYVLENEQGQTKSYPFLTVAGNDEKVFDSPGVGVPSISLTRLDKEAQSKRKAEQGGGHVCPYPQYHSSCDDLASINQEAVCKTVDVLEKICQVIEDDFIPRRTFKGPVFLTRYDLWVDWRKDLKMAENFLWLFYALEGDRTAFQISRDMGLDFQQVLGMLNRFYEKGLITKERISLEFDRAA
ncbi:MAG: DUF4910 domain-containing protein [Candidatus Omnitrophica bacterium]|nr:DUF4910 domain-containing protein [Candidatus Omnitrophota bacterium]